MIAQFHLAKGYQVGFHVKRVRHFPNTEHSFKFRPWGVYLVNLTQVKTAFGVVVPLSQKRSHTTCHISGEGTAYYTVVS